jgi:hypothetical protein
MTTLDRTLRILFNEEDGLAADDTPSRRDNVSPAVERLHRLHGTSLLASAWKRLLQDPNHPIGASCYATSCVLFHRYLHRASLCETNVWSAAMGCALLASKLHDNVKVSPAQVVQVFHQLYRRRRFVMGCASNATLRDQIAEHPSVSCVTLPCTLDGGTSKRDQSRVLDQPPTDPVLQEWIGAVIDAENDVLRQLGFVVYWITGSLAHKYLPYFLDLLLDGDGGADSTSPLSGTSATKEQVAQHAWSYCNDSYRLDLSTRYHPSVVACAAIHLSLLDAALSKTEKSGKSRSSVALTGNQDEKSSRTMAWWKRLADTDRPDDVYVVCNVLLGLKNSFDARAAAIGFVASVSGKSFNDPGSCSSGNASA